MRPARTTCRLQPLAALAWLLVVAAAASGGVPEGHGREALVGGDFRWPVRRYLEAHLSSLEEGLLADATDGRWDRHSLFAAALVAGGVEDPEQLRRYEARLDAWVAELARSGKLSASPRARAAAVFEFMHSRILTGGYQVDATELALALDEGRFNCVSGSVLFQCLAERCGLVVCGLEMPGHAKTRLRLDDGPLDVETTCPGWFRLGREQKRQGPGDRGQGPEDRGQGTEPSPPAASGRFRVQAPGLSQLPPPPPIAPRELTPVEVVAMIYYNRGVDLLTGNRFAEAAAANAKALQLDPQSATARGNLLATLNNWAIDLARHGRYGRAVDLLTQGLALAPDYGPFKTNFVYVDRHRQAGFDRTPSAK